MEAAPAPEGESLARGNRLRQLTTRPRALTQVIVPPSAGNARDRFYSEQRPEIPGGRVKRGCVVRAPNYAAAVPRGAVGVERTLLLQRAR